MTEDRQPDFRDLLRRLDLLEDDQRWQREDLSDINKVQSRLDTSAHILAAHVNRLEELARPRWQTYLMAAGLGIPFLVTVLAPVVWLSTRNFDGLQEQVQRDMQSMYERGYLAAKAEGHDEQINRLDERLRAVELKR